MGFSVPAAVSINWDDLNLSPLDSLVTIGLLFGIVVIWPKEVDDSTGHTAAPYLGKQHR